MSETPSAATPPAPRATRTAQRAAARHLLPTIAERTRAALVEAGIDLEVFLAVPNSGDGIINFGSVAEPNPDDDTWNRVSQMVCQIVKDALSIKEVRTRELVSTTTRVTAPA